MLQRPKRRGSWPRNKNHGRKLKNQLLTSKEMVRKLIIECVDLQHTSNRESENREMQINDLEMQLLLLQIAGKENTEKNKKVQEETEFCDQEYMKQMEESEQFDGQINQLDEEIAQLAQEKQEISMEIDGQSKAISHMDLRVRESALYKQQTEDF